MKEIQVQDKIVLINMDITVLYAILILNLFMEILVNSLFMFTIKNH